MNLEYSTEESIRKWRIWATDPTAFWGRSFSTKTEFLRHVLDSEDNPRKQKAVTRKMARKWRTLKDNGTKRARIKEPLQRRVSLIILNDMIEEEVERLKNLSRTERSSEIIGPEKHLTSAVRNVVREVFQQPQKDFHGRCTYLQRWGAKWSLLHKEYILAPFQNATKK
jgi:hypothetical protein